MSPALRLGHALFGLLVGAILGFIFLPDSLLVDFLRALLSRQGIDPRLVDGFWFPPAAGGAAGAALGLINGAIQDFRLTRTARKEDAFRQTAQAIGSGSRGLTTTGSALEPGAGLAENAREFFSGSADVRVQREWQAPTQDIRFRLADLLISRKYQRDGRTLLRKQSQTVAYYESKELPIPGFNLNPESFPLNMISRIAGIEDIDFPEHAAFSRAYHLSAHVPQSVRRLFDHGPLLDDLGRRHGLSIASHANSIIIYRRGEHLDGGALKGFVQEAAEILRLFEEAVRKASEIAANTPAPRLDARELADRTPGLMGRVARANLVTHADVDAFLHQPVPRYISASIARYPDRFVSALATLIGAAVFLVGALFMVINVRAMLSGEHHAEGVLIGLVFLVLGGVTAYFAGGFRWRCKHLLRYGHLASGRIENIEERGYTIGKETVYKVTVSYPTETGSAQGSCYILAGSVRRARKLLRDKSPARVLYDPRQPRRVLLAEALLNVSEDIEP